LHVQLGADSPDEFDPVGHWRPPVQHDCDAPATLRSGPDGPTSSVWKIVPASSARVLQIDDRGDYVLAVQHYRDVRSGGLDFVALAAEFDILHLTEHGASRPHPLSRKVPHESAIWLRPLFASAPRMVQERTATFFATVHLSGAYVGQSADLRGCTPPVIRWARGGAERARWGARVMIDELVMSHVLTDRAGTRIGTVGAGLYDELRRRNPPLTDALRAAIDARMWAGIRVDVRQ